MELSQFSKFGMQVAYKSEKRLEAKKSFFSQRHASCRKSRIIKRLTLTQEGGKSNGREEKVQ